MQQISWQENPNANDFDMAAKFVQYMRSLKSGINAESTSKVPQLLNAVESDMIILRSLARSPDEISRLNGVQAKLNMFKAFPVNSGKWTWNSDLDLQTTHTPPSPPSPASATYDCSDPQGVSTCSQAATPSEISTTQSASQSVTASAAPSEISTTQSTTPSVTTSSLACPPDRTLSCGQVGMGDHAFPSCACVVTQKPTSEISTIQPTTPPGPTTTSPCLPDQIMTCAQVGMGEHAFSSCGCVVTQESVNSATETTWVTVVGCPSGHTSTCVQNGLGPHAYSSCACVVATGSLSAPAPPALSLVPPVPSPSPLLPQSPESGTISEPAFVTTCMDIRDIYASYTLCPRDQSWVKVAAFSTVEEHEGNW